MTEAQKRRREDVERFEETGEYTPFEQRYHAIYGAESNIKIESNTGLYICDVSIDICEEEHEDEGEEQARTYAILIVDALNAHVSQMVDKALTQQEQIQEALERR